MLQLVIPVSSVMLLMQSLGAQVCTELLRLARLEVATVLEYLLLDCPEDGVDSSLVAKYQQVVAALGKKASYTTS